MNIGSMNMKLRPMEDVALFGAYLTFSEIGCIMKTNRGNRISPANRNLRDSPADRILPMCLTAYRLNGFCAKSKFDELGMIQTR